MQEKVGKVLDYLLNNSGQKLSLLALQNIMNRGIPFNSPHKFQFLEITQNKVRLRLPFLKVNRNHLGGIHACATATLGEYCSGLWLLKNFSANRYRLIMSHLSVEYFKQAKDPIIGIVECDPQSVNQQLEAIKAGEVSVQVDMTTHIFNARNNDQIATVYTTWQLKEWKAVSFK